MTSFYELGVKSQQNISLLPARACSLEGETNKQISNYNAV